MRALQTAFGESDRRVWVADSFTGVPASTSDVDIAAGLDLQTSRYPWLAASLEMVRDNFRTYDLLDDHVRFLPGLFADTLPAAPIGQIALLRLDADLYSSTFEALSALYDRVADNGVVIVDDYGGLKACRRAVDTFREQRSITAPLQRINWTEVWWRKHA
jgi:O-methyltransferase